MKKVIAFVFAALVGACASSESEESTNEDVVSTTEDALTGPTYCTSSQLGTYGWFIDGCCSFNRARQGYYQCKRVSGSNLWIYQSGNRCLNLSCNQ